MHLGPCSLRAGVASRDREIDGMTRRGHFTDKKPEPSCLNSMREAWGRAETSCLGLPSPQIRSSWGSGGYILPSALIVAIWYREGVWKCGVTGAWEEWGAGQ